MKQKMQIFLAAMVGCLFVSCALNHLAAQTPATSTVEVNGKKITVPGIVVEVQPGKIVALPEVEMPTPELTANRSVGCPFQPVDYPWQGATLRDALNNWLDYIGAGGDIPPHPTAFNNPAYNQEVYARWYINAVRAAMAGQQFGGCQYSTLPPYATPTTTVVKGILGKKLGRYAWRYNHGCPPPSVHFIDTLAVPASIRCQSPGVSPWAFWRWAAPATYPTVPIALSKFGGESNALSWADPDQSNGQNLRDITNFWIYASFAMDAAANWGHLQFMLQQYSNAGLRFSLNARIVSTFASGGDGHMALYASCEKYTSPFAHPVDDRTEVSVNASAYPNPTSGNFTVNAPVGATLTVMSPAGQVISTQTATETATNCDLTEQPSGLYFVQVAKPDGSRETLRISKNGLRPNLYPAARPLICLGARSGITWQLFFEKCLFFVLVFRKSGIIDIFGWLDDGTKMGGWD